MKLMSDKKSKSFNENLSFSFISQIYVLVLGIATVPLYFNQLGPEAYGLIGFFTVLQATFNILDLGLSPTISRETSRFKSGAFSKQNYLQLFFSLNIIFAVIAIFFGGLLFYFAKHIAVGWLNIVNLDLVNVIFSLQVMAIAVVFRWMGGLYRGVIVGSEKIFWLSIFSIVIATLRYILVLPVLWIFGANIKIFFIYQLLVAFAEFAGLCFKSMKLIPRVNNLNVEKPKWSIYPIKPFLPFAGGVAINAIVWSLVTQVDKLFVSSLISLEDYGYFSMVVLLSYGIMLIAGPIRTPLMPRLVSLKEAGKIDEFEDLYFYATKVICAIAGSIAIIMIFFSDQILWLWTGNPNLPTITKDLLVLYACGYGFAAISAVIFYLQYAIGKLKLHSISSLFFLITILPLLYILTREYGAIGAGYAWCYLNIFHFFIWTFVVHKRYLNRKHSAWMLDCVFKTLSIPVFIAYLSKSIFIAEIWLTALMQLLITSILIFVIVMFSLLGLHSKFQIYYNNK